MRRTLFAAVLAAVFLLSGLQTTSAVTTLATPTPAPVLRAPTNLQAVRNSAGAIVLTWTDNSTGELGYKVERKVATAAFAEIFRGTTPNQSTFTDDPRLGALYQYRVRAYASGVNGPYSNVAAVTLPIPPSATPTATPTIRAPTLSVEPRNTDSPTATFELFVPDSPNGDIIAIVLQRSVNGGAFVGHLIFLDISGFPPFYLRETDYDLPLNATLRYRAHQVFGAQFGAIPDSNIVTVVRTPPLSDANLRAPDPVTAQIVGAGSSLDPRRVQVSFSDPNTTEEGYAIERKEGASGVYQDLPRFLPRTGNVFRDDFPLRGNTTYFYRVRAFRIVHNSNQTTTTAYGPYSQETSVFFTLPALQISATVNSSAPDVALFVLQPQGSADRYPTVNIQRATGNGPFSTIATNVGYSQGGSSNGSGFFYTDTSVSRGATYRYRAVDPFDELPDSNIVTVSIP